VRIFQRGEVAGRWHLAALTIAPLAIVFATLR
jgi:hypothetical protein